MKCKPLNPDKTDRTWIEGGLQEKCARCTKDGHPCGPQMYPSENSPLRPRDSHVPRIMSIAAPSPELNRSPLVSRTGEGHAMRLSKELAEDSLELKRKLGQVDLQVEASRVLKQRIDQVLEDPDYAYYGALLSLQAANFNKMVSLLGLATPLADRLEAAGEVDVAENAYIRMLDIYRAIDPNSWYEVRGLLWKLATLSWRLGHDQRGQSFAWEALQCRDQPARADRSDLDWLRELSKSLCRTANAVAEIVRSTAAIVHPPSLTEPIPLLHRLMESGYASSVTGNIFWTASLPNPRDAPSSEHPIVGGISTVLDFVRGLSVTDLLARDHEGRSALHMAAHLGKEALGIALMIRADEIPGMKPRIMDSRDHTTQTILGTSVCKRCSLTFIESLIEYGADVNPDMAILNPLQAACWFGFLEVVDVLMRRGANPSKSLPDGKTALDLALEQGHQNIVQRLGHTPHGSPSSSSSHTFQ